MKQILHFMLMLVFLSHIHFVETQTECLPGDEAQKCVSCGGTGNLRCAECHEDAGYTLVEEACFYKQFCALVPSGEFSGGVCSQPIKIEYEFQDDNNFEEYCDPILSTLDFSMKCYFTYSDSSTPMPYIFSDHAKFTGVSVELKCGADTPIVKEATNFAITKIDGSDGMFKVKFTADFSDCSSQIKKDCKFQLAFPSGAAELTLWGDKSLTAILGGIEPADMSLVIADDIIYTVLYDNCELCEIGALEKCASCDGDKCGDCNPGYHLVNGACVQDAEYCSEYEGTTCKTFKPMTFTINDVEATPAPTCNNNTGVLTFKLSGNLAYTSPSSVVNVFPSGTHTFSGLKVKTSDTPTEASATCTLIFDGAGTDYLDCTATISALKDYQLTVSGNQLNDNTNSNIHFTVEYANGNGYYDVLQLTEDCKEPKKKKKKKYYYISGGYIKYFIYLPLISLLLF